ncbi:peamaclein-like [Mangifera indica]|uniref:peamaclein-like n=1 Tax=Mangifera indica TaxID=29780 RepID=UPI001CFC1B81|nr:peamaclein-like [Mangifera indica]
MKVFLTSLLLVSLLLCSAHFQCGVADCQRAAPQPPVAPGPAGSEVFCNAKCEGRCAKAGEQKRCKKYCMICCSECKCVPSGTYGNKSECPCYGDKLNSKGKPKCP